MLPNCDNSAAHPAAKAIDPRILTYSRRGLAAAPIDLNVEVPDLLPQRIAVEAEQVSGADLVAARCRQRGREQRHLDFLEDAVVEARRRHAVREAREVRRQVRLDRAAEVLDA